MALDNTLMEVAAQQRNLLDRAAVLAAGGTDASIAHRLRTGRMRRCHAGVYSVAAAPPSWLDHLQAAVLAAGDGALVSHRAALVLWGLDGLRDAPVEITVPYEHAPIPASVVRHRTRRPMVRARRRGLPVTSVERTLIDCAAVLPARIVELAMDSAVRRSLTTYALIAAELARVGGRGVKGTRVMRALLAEHDCAQAPGSPAETLFLRILKDAGIALPELQGRILLADGTVAVVDALWPERRKVVEVDGLEAHGSGLALESDLERQNALLSAGYELRRFSGRQIRRRPAWVAARVADFLRR